MTSEHLYLTPRAVRVSGPFVGRRSEIETLRVLLERARVGAGQSVMIEGEAGIGKTRLVAQILAEADARGFRAFRGAADELEHDRPFGALAETLGLDARASDPERAEISRLLVGEIASSMSPIPYAQTPELRFRIVEALVSLGERLCAEGPLVIAVEDLHWADPSTLVAIHHVTRRLADRPLLFIGTCRPLPRPVELMRMAEHIAARGGLHLVLDRLDAEAVLALVAAATQAPPGESLVRQVAGAGGNPLFITELVAALVEEGAIEMRAGKAESRAAPLPPSLRLTFLRRLSSLPDPTLDMLRVASVLGTSFSLFDLSVVVDRAATELLTTLESVIRAGILEGTRNRLAFRHDLLREAIYEDLPLAIRVGLHLQAGRALARAGASAAQVASHLALGASSDDEEAVTWLRRSAREAVSRAPGIAVETLRRALQIAPPFRRDEVTTELARALLWAGHADEAEALARDLLERGCDQSIAGSLHSVRAVVLLMRGRLSEAVEEGLEGAKTSTSPKDEANARAFLASTKLLTGDVAGAEMAAREALAAGEAAGSASAQCNALLTLSALMSYRLRARESLELSDRAVALAAGDTTGEAHLSHPWVLRGLTLVWTDRFVEADEALRKGRSEIERLGTVGALPLYHLGAGTLNFFTGDWDDAAAEAETSLTLAEDLGTRMGIVWAWGMLALMAIHRDDLARAGKLVAAAELEVAERGPAQFSLEWTLLARALLLEVQGEFASALAMLGGVWDFLMSLGLVGNFRMLGPELVRIALAAGERERAASIATESERIASHSDGFGEAAAVRCRGLVDDDPEVLLRAAAAYGHDARVLDRAQCFEEAGSALGRAARVDEAIPLLEEALVAYEGLGATRDLGRAEAALRAFGVRRRRRTRPRRETVGWDSLTATELHVVRLAAEGLTNRQIGERLFISRRTVETHLAHVFQKLGLSTRVQLAAETARRLG